MEPGDASSTGISKKLQFTDVVGNFGKWQLIICLHVWMMLIANVMQNMIITFHAPNIPYHCSIPEGFEEHNVSMEDWILHGIPRDDEGLLSKCIRYENWDIGEPNRSTVQCNHWDYNTSSYANTIINKFDLVCDRRWMISLLKSCFMFGYMGAGLISGISDRFGRRPVILASMCLFLVSSLLSPFSTSFVMLAVLRFILALAVTTCTTVTFILQTEILGTKKRVDFTYLRSSMWTGGMLLLVAIAYFVRDWLWLQITVSLPFVLLAISMWWFVPESPRFLLTHGHKEQASAILKTAARHNGITIANMETVLQDLLDGIQKDNSKASHASLLDLFRSPELRKRLVVLFCAWFISILVYYSVTYNTNRLHGDMYVNFTISAVVEIPGMLIFWMISRTLGRRRSLFISMTASGTMLIGSQLVPEGQPQLVIALMMTGKGLIKVAITDLYLYTIEVLPTVVRAVGLGSCSTFSRIGGIIAPFALNLGSISVILFGVLSASAGFSILFLPETHKKHVADTVREARNLDS